MNKKATSHQPNESTKPQQAPDERIMLLEQQVAELTDALQRERADVMNVRRRHDEQIVSLRTSVKAHVVHDLLPVIDNFERALKHLPSPASSGQPGDAGVDSQKTQDWIDGVSKILAQFEKTLSGIGVERIKTVGEPFDPRYHEAISMEEGDGTEEIVCEELQAGYKIDDHVVRHAMVRVRA